MGLVGGDMTEPDDGPVLTVADAIQMIAFVLIGATALVVGCVLR